MEDIDLMYQEQILDHYKNPHNFGKMENASVHHHEKNPLCGDELDIYLTIDESNKITDAKFSGHGCAISQASASMLTDEAMGKSLSELSSMTRENILKMLGIPISPARLKCAILSLDTLKNSILIYEKYIKNANRRTINQGPAR